MIHNSLAPETTEKLVYIHLNSKKAGNTRDAAVLNIFAWDNGNVEALCLGAELPNSQDAEGAHFG